MPRTSSDLMMATSRPAKATAATVAVLKQVFQPEPRILPAWLDAGLMQIDLDRPKAVEPAPTATI